MQNSETLRHVALDGTLVLADAAAVQAQIAEALDRSTAMCLDLSNASEIDVSFLQILIAAKKTALQDGKVLTIAASGSALLQQQMARCGLPASALPAFHDRSTRSTTGQQS